jgi:hypothetical protein
MDEQRPIWLALALLTGVIVGFASGGLAWLGDTNVAHAIIEGGAAFGAATLLLITIFRFLAK